MNKQCDNTSVGVIIRDKAGRFALLKRAKFPIGIAPVAGHIDNHGSPEKAARDEVEEELGLKIERLLQTIIYERLVQNKCRREGGDHHTWYIFETKVVDANLKPSQDETKGAAWYTQDQLNDLAERTRAYWAGEVPEEDWNNNPGLEEVWMPFMEELGYVVGIR